MTIGPSQVIDVELPSGSIVQIAAPFGISDQYASPQAIKLREVLPAIGEFGSLLLETLKTTAPTRVAVEFGVAFKGESAGLTSVFVNAGAEGTISVSLEWERTEAE